MPARRGAGADQVTRKRTAALAGIALAGIAGAAALVHERSAGGTHETAAGTAAATAPIVTTDVLRRQAVAGTLGRSGTFTVIAPAPGTLTWLPPAGAVVGRGRPAYEVDGTPVLLLLGDRPPWRTLRGGMTDGADVQQLEDNLRALGYGAGLTVDQHFSPETSRAVRRWQKDSGLPVTGTVPLGQVVFVAGAVRVTGADVTAGSPVERGASVEHGTGEERAVTVQLTPNLLAGVRAGDPVVVRLPDGTATPATVTSVGAVSQRSGAEPTATAVVTVTGEIGLALDEVPVQVWVTVQAHRKVLAVPIPALRALPGVRYELLVADGARIRHVPVEVGLFDEVGGVVEVSGAGLAAGERVAVPHSTT
jgi:peptidoglycan hydrolase-like protein with peptidoglycan-binding domain